MRRTVVPSWLPVAALATFVSVLWAGPSLADKTTPVGGTPPELLGDWGTSFGSLTPAIVHIGSGQVTITSASGETLGSISGTFSTSGEMNLTVSWEVLAFQFGQANPLPSSAWPGNVITDLTLNYDAAKDEFSGSYGFIDIGYDEKGEYQTSDRSTVSIRLIHTLRTQTGTAVGPEEQP